MPTALNLRSLRKSKNRRMFIEALEDRKVLDAEPLLVKDINTSDNPGQLYMVTESPTVIGSIGLYSGYTVETGRELWRTDGTEAGTYLVKDIEAGAGDSLPLLFVEMDGNYYFVAATSGAGRELWRTDGTEAGTSMVLDINPGIGSSDPDALYAADGKLYFSAMTPGSGRELWSSDGTAEGTAILADLQPGPGSNGASEIYKVGNHLLFNTSVTDTAGFSHANLGSLDLSTGNIEYADPFLQFGTAVELSNGNILFVGFSGSLGHELWTSDGTISGTTLVADLEPNGSSSVNIWTRFNGATIVSYVVDTTLRVASLSDDGAFEVLVEAPSSDGMFTVSAALSDRLMIASPLKLYSSDGTAAGTAEVTLPTDFAADLRDTAVFAGSLYFGSSGAGFGAAKYDPVIGEVARVIGDRSAQSYSFQATAEGVYWVDGPTVFPEILFTADGVNTESFFDTEIGSWYYVQPLDTVNDQLVFVATNGLGVGLRGASGNAVVNLSPNEPGPTSDSVTGTNTVQLNGYQFVAVYVNGRFEFWRTDGTEAGTIQLTSNGFDLTPLKLVATESKVYAVGRGPTGVELWSSDGTVDGTTFVTTLGFQPDWLVAYQDQLVIAGNGGLWASDGSASDLRLIQSIEGTIEQVPAMWDDAIYFNTSVNDVDQIWKLQSLVDSTLTSVPNTVGLKIVKSVANDKAIAFTTRPVDFSGAYDLWITHDGFASWDFIATNVLDMHFAGGMLYYNEFVQGEGWHVMRSDAGKAISPDDLGTFLDVILFEIDEVLYAKVTADSNTWQILSTSGPHGTLQAAALLGEFDDLVSEWQLEELDGKAIGPTRFLRYGTELGIASPESQVVLQNAVIAENDVPQAIVGTIGTAWTNAALGQATFSLVPGDGSDSNSLFTVDSNNDLVSLISLDAEQARTHSIRLRADYPSGEAIESVVTVFVQNVDEKLDQVFLSSQRVREDAAPAAIVGRFVTVTEPGETVTYEILSIDGSAENLQFRIEGDRLLVNGPLDFETTAIYNLEVRITSSIGLTVTRTFQVFVVDVNENSSSPIQLSSSSLFENNLSGPVFIGNLSVPGSAGSFVYSLDPTWHDSSLFFIEGDALYFNDYADFETRDNYSVRIIASNGIDPDISSPLTIDILAVDEFPITGLRFIAGDFEEINTPFLFENSPIGQPATRIEVIDQDRGDTYTISGTFGSFDSFGDFATIVGDSFVPIRTINFEALSQTFGFPINISIETNGVPSFSVSWNTSSIRDVNDAPAIANPISNIYAETNVFTSISLSNLIVDEDVNDSLTFTVSYNGGALPSWLIFTAPNALAAIPGDADVGVYEVSVTATDLAGVSVTKTFTITVEDPIDVNGTAGNDTIRITPNDVTGTTWSIFVNGTRTFNGLLNRPVTFSGSAGNDRLFIEATTGSDNFVFGGVQASVGSLRSKFYDFETIEIRGRGGNDNFTYTGDLNPFSGFTVLGGVGQDTLIGPSLANQWTISGTDAGTLGQVTFSSVENLRGSIYDDTFTMLPGARITGSIDGQGGTLDYSLRNTTVSVTVEDLNTKSGIATNVAQFTGINGFKGNESQTNTFTLANSPTEYAVRWETFARYSVVLEFSTFITGFKRLVGSPAADNFYVAGDSSPFNFDGSTGFDEIIQLGPTSVVDLRTGTGSGIASFTRIEQVGSWGESAELYGPNANTTWSVNFDTITPNQGVKFRNYATVYGGTRNDTFEILPGLSYTRNILGGAGTDAVKTVELFPEPIIQANWKLLGVGTGRVSNGQVSSDQFSDINFSGIENLVGGRVDFDFVEFTSIPTQTWFNSLTGLVTGNIVVTYQPSIAVSGTVTVDPVNDPPVVVNLESRTATGLGSFDFVQYWIANSNTNSDRLIGRNLDTNWFISGAGGASSDSRTNFEGFETIVGGNRNDVFQINYGTAVPMRIEAGAGRNTLDFTFYPNPISIDLATGTGSPFVSGHSGFVDVIGTMFDDYISGNAADNILVGLSGNDLLRGLTGNDVLIGGNGNDQLFGGNGRDLLVGGLGADLLFGGNDEDILISGVSYMLNNDNQGTNAGLNRDAVAAVMTEWTSNRSYALRQTRIRSGASSSGLHRLDSTTVFNDSDVDQVFGEGGRDLFWLGGLDLAPDIDGTELNNPL